MGKLSISELVEIYAISKQEINNFLMQIYKSDENFFKYGQVFSPMVSIPMQRTNQHPMLDSRALEAFEDLYQRKMGHPIRHKKPEQPKKIAEVPENSPPQDYFRKR